MTVTKDTLLTDLLEQEPDSAEFFYSVGMHCIGCFASMYESIGDACMVHGYDPDDIIDDLNDFLERQAEHKKEIEQAASGNDKA